MQHRSPFKTVVVTAIIIAVSAFASAQEGDAPAMSPEVMAEMEMWMKLAQPAGHHEHLAAMVGTWDGEVQMWMAPGTEPMMETSTAEAEMIMGGRYLSWIHTGNFGDMPYEGMAIEAYNNGDKRYESVWIDNFGTLILYFEGSCTDDGRSRDMATSFSDPMTGGSIGYRSEYRWVDDDHFTYTTYMDKGDGELKNAVITYTRRDQ